MSNELRAVLEGIVYGSDPKITPADRLRAAEQLQALPDETQSLILREVLAMNPAAVHQAYDEALSAELPQLLDGGAAA